MIDVIGFDADDTLWDNEIYYRRTKEEFITLMSPYQPDVIAGEKLDEIEVGNIRVYGYGIKSFGLSMIEAALELSGGQLNAATVSKMIQLIKEMLTTEVPLTAGVEDTLTTLAARYPLMLITKGDLFEQERKIDRSGIVGYFRFIEVVSEKTTAGYQRVLEKYGIDPARFLMVGNSLKSDILPVLTLGGRAVYIPHDQTWHHETVDDSKMAAWHYGQIEQLVRPACICERPIAG